MKTRNVSHFVWTLLLFTFISCQKDKHAQQKTQHTLVYRFGDTVLLQQYHEFLYAEDITGAFQLINLDTHYIKVAGGIAGSDGIQPVAAGVFTLSTFSFSPDPHFFSYQASFPKTADLFGKMATFTLAGSASAPGFADSLYVPKRMVLTSAQDSASYYFSRTGGYTFTWEPDFNNAKGVVITLTYTPGLFADRMQNAPPYGDPQIITLLVPDNGSFTLNASHIATIPDGGYLDVSLLRPNFKKVVANDGIRKIGISAYSETWSGFVVQP